MELFENLYENLRMLVWGMVRPQVPTKDELGVGHTRTRGASDIPGHQSPRIMFGKGGPGTAVTLDPTWNKFTGGYERM